MEGERIGGEHDGVGVKSNQDDTRNRRRTPALHHPKTPKRLVFDESRVENPARELRAARFVVTEYTALPQDGMRIAFLSDNPLACLEHPRLNAAHVHVNVEIASSTTRRRTSWRGLQRPRAFRGGALEVDSLLHRSLRVHGEVKVVLLVPGSIHERQWSHDIKYKVVRE